MSILIGPWSYSRASACARALYMEKVVKAPPEPRPERFLAIDRRDFGSALHLGAENMLRGLMQDGHWPDPVTTSLDCVKFEKNGQRPYFHLASDVSVIEERLRTFKANFRRDWNQEEADRDALIRDSILGSEMRLAVDGDGKPCAFESCPVNGWRGIIDYADVVDGMLLILDFKNRPAIFSQADLRRDEQLSGYVDLVLKHFPQFQVERYGIHYFEFGFTQYVDFDSHEDLIRAVEENVARLHARARFKESLTEDQIGPEPGFGKCQYCDYLNSCDAGKAYIVGGTLAPTDLDQARQLANWLMVTEEKVKASKEALKMFVAEFGAIELDDKTQVGYSVNLEAEEYDAHMTLRLLKQLIDEGKIKDMKLSDFTKIDTTLVKKVAKAQIVNDALAPARNHKPDMKFQFFRPTSRQGVRAQKEGRAMVVHPEDRQTPVKVKAGGRK